MWPMSTDCRRELWARYVPTVDRLPFIPLGTSFSGFSDTFRRFPAFRLIQAALAYPSDQFCQK